MLTSAMVLIAVAVILPLMVLLVALITRPPRLHLLGAFVGGIAYAITHVTWDILASLAGWWHFTSGLHAPLWYYLGSLSWGTCTALIGWPVQRRFGPRGAAIYLVGLGVLGVVNDYAEMTTLDTSAIIAFAPGWAPVLADIVCSGTNALMALLAMRFVAGPASVDRLIGDAPYSNSNETAL
jgi:hypothetical protein